jgi:aminotransferase
VRVARAVAGVAPSGIRRFFDVVAQMDDVISLGVGEPDFVTPWRIREAAIDSLERGFTQYTSNAGLPALRRAISEYLRRTAGVDYSPEDEILVTVGVSEALDLALRAILDPGDEVLIPEPCYVSYPPCALFAGGVPVPVPGPPELGFAVDPVALTAAVSPRARAMLLNYPNNPTGATLRAADLAPIARLARQADLLVISDEIYAELTYTGRHVSLASLPGMKERTLLLNGFSKAYAMTGWRIGYAAGPRDWIQAMARVHQYTMLCAPMPSQRAALEALRGGTREVEEMMEQYRQRSRVFAAGLRAAGLPCRDPEGAFYAFPSVAASGLSSEQFAESLLHEQHVAVVPGNAFGACGEGFVRCSYAASPAHLEEALRRIDAFMRRLADTSGAPHRAEDLPGASRPRRPTAV